MSKRNPVAENPFSGYHENFDREESPILSTEDLAKSSTRVASTSLIWFAATVATSVISDGGIESLKKEIKLNPTGFTKGALWMLPYNIGIANIATEAHRSILGADHSYTNSALAAFGGATSEALVGNPFDMASLGGYFHGIKLRTALRQNPDGILPKFSTEELRKMMPEYSPALSREELLKTAKAENYSQISFGGRNLEMMAEKTGIKFTLQDFAKINGAILIPSIFRNLPSYFAMGMAHQSSQSGEGINWGSSLAIAAAGATITLVPNTAIYQTGNNIMKGMEPFEALKSAFKDSAKSVAGDPSKIGILLAIRTAALLSTSLIFTPQFGKAFDEAVNAVSENIKESLGITESLSAEGKKEIDTHLQKTILKPDPKILEETAKTYEALLTEEASKEKPKPAITSSQTEQLSKASSSERGSSN